MGLARFLSLSHPLPWQSCVIWGTLDCQMVGRGSNPLNMDIEEGPSAQEIQLKIAAGPDATFDWLDQSASQDTIAATLSAMANSEGGVLVIGVTSTESLDGKDNPDITGVANPDEMIDRILTAALSLTPALILPLPNPVDIGGRPVVVVRIAAGMPHIYAAKGLYLHRKGTSNTGVPPVLLRRLFVDRGEISFEMEMVPGASLEDLHWGKVQTYVNQLSGVGGRTAEEILLKRGCLVQRGDQLCPTNAGILLFGNDPQRYVRGADITAVRFAGETMSDTFNRQDITGTLPEQIRIMETFLVDHLRKGVRLSAMMARRERYEYPMEAARELVVNAVAHRDYSIQGDGIRLFLFKDRMEVTSPGGLPGPVTVANIEDERFSRNPAIVQVLSDMGYIERLGYGIKRVIELMHQRDLRAPIFAETDGGFQVKLFNQPEEKVEIPSVIPGIQSHGDFSDHQEVSVNPRQQAALAFLSQPQNTRITNSVLQRLFPDVHAETIRRDLADLVTKNILSKKGQKRGSYYVLNPGQAQED